MPKINYKIVVLIASVILIALYLYLAHSYIFYRISAANLKYVNMQQVYTINDNMDSEDNVVYTALGDSLTAGAGVDDYQQSFPYIVAQKIAKNDSRVTLKDFSVPGYKTQDLLDFLVTPAVASSSDIITLLVGTNDIYNNVSQENFTENYRAILDKIKTIDAARVYLISIPFIGSQSLIFPPYSFYYDKCIENFNKIISDLAQEYGFAYVDIATPTKDLFKSDGPHYSADAFHPAAPGYALWANIIYDAINK